MEIDTLLMAVWGLVLLGIVIALGRVGRKRMWLSLLLLVGLFFMGFAAVLFCIAVGNGL